MLRTMLIYGGIGGGIIIAFMAAKSFGLGDPMSEVQGYLSMLVALSFIFVGIKRYRDTVLGGVIKFLPALALGLGIAAVAGVLYVVSWEISLQMSDFAFVDAYRDMMVTSYQEQGLTEEALAAKVEEMDNMMALYQNPLFRVPITFLEIFPVGLVISLISAALLRNPKILPARS